jgi:hypothetical protein
MASQVLNNTFDERGFPMPLPKIAGNLASSAVAFDKYVSGGKSEKKLAPIRQYNDYNQSFKTPIKPNPTANILEQGRLTVWDVMT